VSTVRDGIVAGSVAGVISGVPSTVWALASGGDPLEATRAAGTILLPREQRRGRLLLAAVPVHLTLSIGWAVALAAAVPRERTIELCALAGLGIAALDLGVIGRRLPAIRALAQPPQVADHLAYGLTVGVALTRIRGRALLT
jgi:hypothetical protein